MVLALSLSFLSLVRLEVVYVIVHIGVANIADGCYTAAQAEHTCAGVWPGTPASHSREYVEDLVSS